MPQELTKYKVLIASPSDVRSDAQVAFEVLTEWSEIEGERHSIVIQPIMWEKNAVPEMGDSPQSILNRQLTDTCDMVIGIFGTRLGTPTAEYDSGTVEEIERAFIQDKLVSAYFSQAHIEPSKIDLEQLAKLRDYEKSCRPRGLHCSYSGIIEFRKQIRIHVPSRILVLHEKLKSSKQSAEPQPQLDDELQDNPRIFGIEPKKPFEELLRTDKNVWLTAATRHLMDGGVAKIKPALMMHVAKALYDEKMRGYEQDRLELLASIRRRQVRNPETFQEGASERLPNEDVKD